MLSLAYLCISGACAAAVPEETGEVVSRQRELRAKLRKLLGIPTERCDLAPESRGQTERDGIVVEKWVWTTEPGSKTPALVYRPKEPKGKLPAIVLTYGHGGSKSSWQYNYAAQVYAKLGLACVATDPIGEEERNLNGGVGTRAHDPKPVSDRADAAGRLIMGKLAFDTMRSVDYLMTRDDIDHERLGIAGNSLGGATGGWVAALEPRLRMALICGWAYDDVTLPTKFCTRLPNERMRKLCEWPEYAALPAPNCAVLMMNGDVDDIIDRGDREVWPRTRAVVEEAEKTYSLLGAPGKIQTWFETEGGHRPYFVYKRGLEWIHEHLGTPGWTREQIRALPTVNSGEWCDQNGVKLETLYGVPLHQRGATLPDMGIRPIPREELAVLRPEEVGQPDFAIEGWLDKIEGGR